MPLVHGLEGVVSLRIRRWLREEWPYQELKFGEADRFKATDTFGQSDDEWKRSLDQYYNRARVLGLDTPAGRQALAKYVATAVAMLENVITVHGHLPTPGVPSGENVS